MIGDRLDTDILFGKHGGVSTLLVLTGTYSVPVLSSKSDRELAPGVTKESDISGPAPSPIVPDYILQSLGDIAVLTGEEIRI